MEWFYIIVAVIILIIGVKCYFIREQFSLPNTLGAISPNPVSYQPSVGSVASQCQQCQRSYTLLPDSDEYI